MQNITLESFRGALRDRVPFFASNLSYYKSKQYDEAKTRIEFIDPFFMSLGWDVGNTDRRPPLLCEVEVENRVNISGRKKKVDYLFRIGGINRLVCEAKKPEEDLAPYAFQAQNYAWGKKIHVALLTDFEDLWLYVVGAAPNLKRPFDSVKTWHFTDYEKCAQELWDLLARDNVANGSLEKFVTDLPKLPVKKTGTWYVKPQRNRDIDDQFLAYLDSVRSKLAKTLVASNPRFGWGETGLNEAVQRILDRILFVRICEDRDIDTYRPLARIVEDWRANGNRDGQLYPELVSLFQRLAPQFNGGLFGKAGEPAHFSESLKLDDRWLAAFIEELSREDSNYQFNNISVEILGSVYERFLGKVIRVTPGGTVKVELKPEVRKAGGVYYTPEYIVRYIVENTVGKLLVGKTPKQVAEMRFADIACGSGSFLLRVFERICEYYAQWFTDHPKNQNQRVCYLDAQNSVHLTTGFKRDILRKNIYGVDIDQQAVEVTQLSLYLKILEGETRNSLAAQRLLFPQETILPDLSQNIVCGNSLVGRDILDDQLFASDEERKLNPMNFEDAFPHVFGRQPGVVREPAAPYGLGHEGGRRWYPAPLEETRGFDAIVGNPPYILLQILEQRCVFDYIAAQYRAAKYKIDTYHVFLERALSLTKTGGLVGYITPNSFLRNKHARELRRLLLDECKIELLRLFFYQVFSGASVDTSVIVLERNAQHEDQHRIAVLCSTSSEVTAETQWQPQRIWREHPENCFSLPGVSGSEELEAKMRDRSLPLGEFATAYFGIQTFDREKHVKPRQVAKRFKPVIDGGHINRYVLQRGSEFVDFCPNAIKSGGNSQVYEQPRIGVRQIGRTPIATFLPASLYTLNTIYNIFFTKPTGYDLKFILGIVSSKPLGWYWLRSFFDQKETFPKIKKDALLSIPIPHINFSDDADKARHDAVVTKVEAILAAKKDLAKAKADKDTTYYENKCAALDRQIDALVYELYGLTAEEIKLVEGAGKS